MRLARITDVLKKVHPDWKVLFLEKQSAATYLTKGWEIETGIDATRTQADVTIYKRYGKLLGEASFTLFSDDKETIKREVKIALQLCATAKKPAYPLAKKARMARVALADPRIVQAFKGGPDKLQKTILAKLLTAYRRERGVKLNSGELQLTSERRTVRNSEGVNARVESTHLFCMVVLTSHKGKREQEFQGVACVRRISDFDPAAFIKECSKNARDILSAKRLGKVHAGIVLSQDALNEFWSPELTHNPIVMHGIARIKHMGLSMFELGEQITGRHFSLASNPCVPYSILSSRFDHDGSPSKRVELVKNGVVRNFAASQRFAHYLDLPVTGALGVVELGAGTIPVKKLREGAVDVVSFSSFVPNSLSGDFSAEIRLGYIHRKGKRIPVRAAMFTGNIFKMLDGMTLSRETFSLERYKGPIVRFDGGASLVGF